jgi:hypothetical protein
VLAAAPDTADAWQWEATAAQRTLIERDADGARLLKESGPLARLRITARPAWAPMGRIEFSAALAHAQLDYDGRTQAGTPLATHSRHDEAEIGARWRPSQAFAWGLPSITFDGLRFRRAIEPTATVGSLVETSTMWLPGVAWASPAWPVGTSGTAITLRAQWRTSVHHHVDVDYAGVFDPSSLHGGRRDEASLAAVVSTPTGWSLALEWHRARQAQSDSTVIYRSGVAAGTVLQPRIAIDDVGLTLSRSF